MKKEYIKPEIEMAIVEAEHMLAASFGPQSGNGYSGNAGANSLRDEWDDLWN